MGHVLDLNAAFHPLVCISRAQVANSQVHLQDYPGRLEHLAYGLGHSLLHCLALVCEQALDVEREVPSILQGLR